MSLPCNWAGYSMAKGEDWGDLPNLWQDENNETPCSSRASTYDAAGTGMVTSLLYLHSNTLMLLYKSAKK